LTAAIFSPDETDKIHLSQQIIVNAVMKILDFHVKNIDKLPNTKQVQAEIMTDFLVGLASNKENALLQKLYKQEII
jgi:hypothetical protein